MSLPDLDSQDIAGATLALPEQLERAAELAWEVEGLPEPGSIGSVVVLGMGGSGVAGEILQAVGGPRLPVPVVLVGEYRLPEFVKSDTLVFAVSFSGETEETLEAATEAARRGARLVAVTTGGRLALLARDHGAPVFSIEGDIPQPRAGIAATTAPLLVACERLGLLDGVRAEIECAVSQLRLRRDEHSAGGGVAADLARRLDRTIPLVQGASGIGAVAARRWKTQVNENAKSPAFAASQPEWCHNEICGFGQGGDITRQVATIVMLRSDHEHPRVVPRFEIGSELVSEAVAAVVEVRASGDGPLAQLFDLVIVGDFVSLHMAARADVDPGPVPVLVEMKERLAAM